MSQSQQPDGEDRLQSLQRSLDNALARWHGLSFRRRTAIVAAVLFGGLLLALLTSGGRSLPDGVAAAPIEPRPLNMEVRAQGTLRAHRQMNVYPRVAGTVVDIAAEAAEANGRVSRGEAIVTLDDEDIRIEVEDAEAALWGAKAELASALGRYQRAIQQRDRAERLYREDLIPRDERDQERAHYEDMRAALETARAHVRQAEIRLEQARDNLQHTEVRSPIDGRVLNIAAELGDRVAPGGQTPVFTVAAGLEPMELRLEVNEADIGKIRAGQRIRFNVEAYRQEDFHAEVRRVLPGGYERRGVQVYEVRADAENPHHRLMPGMSVQARIHIEQTEPRPAIPLRALVFEPESERLLDPHRDTLRALRDEGRSIIWIQDRSGEIRPAGVELGEQDDEYAVLRDTPWSDDDADGIRVLFYE
ncbi:efflux RND transporter periplasmic adaptor subunit [Alkalilimnicola ehrlichii MLHE-1]|uniref:Efflux transporter, RND family, MFP subunit n=1 Tax=Alkalilimnicola ehrlichii (strain ATCC BAA-1101 / DSM 17681 / MLHE-1) TaxID=187272 RepID=Q0A6P9_ALKEH|nr:efflux RND transporter periplasmic adaptor subunit [Alkalilimnicola ehrlichii]ABI57488.1 efflux transporter, RND family, MFP subunit [Alkalilimnicola ehrlichii MLHE-1]